MSDRPFCGACKFQVPLGASKCGHCGTNLTWDLETINSFLPKKDPAWVTYLALASGGAYFLFNIATVFSAADGWLWPLLKVGFISLLIWGIVLAFIQPAFYFIVFGLGAYILYEILKYTGAF